MCNRDEIMGRDEGEDTDRSSGEDTDRSRGEDTDRGRGEDTERDRSKDTERGRGEDTDRSRGEDTDRSRGEDTDRSRGEDRDRGRSEDTDKDRSKDTDKDMSKDTDKDRSIDMGTNSRDKENGIKDKKDSTSEDKCSTGEDKDSRSERRGSQREHMDQQKNTAAVTSRLTTTEEVNNNDHEGRVVVEDGWDWVVIFAAFMIDLLTGTAKHSFGVIYSRYFLKLGTSATQVSLIYNLAYVLSGFTAFLVGPVLPESMLRRVTFLSGLFYSLGIIASAFATSALGIFFCFTIVSGVTIMLLSVTSFAVVTKYFNNQSTAAALSFVTSGYGVGQFLMPLIITRLHMEYGFQGSTLITGAIMLNLCVCAMLLHPVEWHIKKPQLVSLTRHDGSNPQNYGKQPSADHQTTPVESQIQNRITELALSHLRLLKSPTTFVVCVVLSLNLFALINVGPTVPFAMMADGFKLEEAATCMSLAGICNLMSKLGLSLLTYSPPGTNNILPVYIVGSLISAVSLVVFGQVSSLGWRAVSLGLSGCGGAMVVGLPTLLVEQLLGPQMVLPVLTTVHFVSAIVIGFMGFVLGEAHDLSGNYSSCFWLLGATLFMGVFLWVFLPIAAAFKRKRKGVLPPK
ncbi:hypothetical protein Pmani_016604 [Petrolisthes manimaculis]|uniref:Uncharacterized protein n=1 Tax=Petrolisthes manimaculis TaxID=1843537 RepID=A0AAE1PP44_9EUCA|nr:hypothetical protein Pmani_016604 [Petrolisthes manimaculis]